MEFSWTSFTLEIINFLVLIWILKYFFYSPIQQVIMKRQHIVQDKLDKAQNIYDAAHTLQGQYENRLKIWDGEKEEERKVFEQSLEDWKLKQQDQFKQKLVQEKEKSAAQQMQATSSIIKQNAKIALLNASKFAAKFLMGFADKDLEKKCVDKVIDELSVLSEEKIALLHGSFKGNEAILVESAYPLNEQQRTSLTKAIQKVFDVTVHIEFTQNLSLLAGLNIKMGTFFLQANLRDELAFFAEIENG